ncbi:MAG: hypothetical protein Pg6A_19750 [Termitinemataceae bacterium]|nr:MAG: hypothetical protein Pg6A_19750 [Termitinemataceae bacterium]
MQVKLTYMGFHPDMEPRPYLYHLLAEDGQQDEMFQPSYIKGSRDDLVITMDDRLWAKDAGWAHIQCDKCLHDFWERTFPGGEVECPRCGCMNNIPNGIKLKGWDDK